MLYSLDWVSLLFHVTIKRMLSIIVNPNRYKSKAADTFSKEILTLFVNPARDQLLIEP